MARVVKGLLAAALLVVFAVPALAEDNRENKAAYGVIKSLNADQQKLVVRDNNGKDWAYHVPKDAKVFIPGNDNARLNDLKANDDVGVLWDRTSDDKLRAFAIVQRSGDFKGAGIALGTIKSTDATGNSITASDAAGKDWTYHMADKARLRANDKEAKLNDFKANERVILVWDKKGDKYEVLAMCAEPQNTRER